MKRAIHIILLGISCMFTACSDWTEIRTKGSLVPGEVENYRYIVHNTNIFRRTFSWQDIASDDAYVYDETQQADLVALGDNTKYTAYYTWSQEIYDLTESDTDFEQAYRAIYYSNVVINEVMDSEGDEEEKQEVRAEALVYRAEAHLALVNMYGKPYRAESASTDQGVPLMTEPRVEGSLPRATVSEVYDQIIDDLTEAIPYLPDLPEHTFYPSKCAAYAFLARAYLYMGDYDNAQANAESALGLQDGLENLNDYYGGDTYPDALEDREVIMAKMVSNRFRPSSASSSSSSSAAGYLVLNEDLLSLFDQENDLRYLFFTAPISDYSSRYVEGRVFRREDFYDSENSIAVQTYKRNGWAMNHGSSHGGFSLNGGAYRNLTTLDPDQRLFNKNFKTSSTDSQNDGIIFARTNIGGNWYGQNNFLKSNGLISLYSDTNGNNYFGYSLCYPLQVNLTTKTYIWKRVS